MATLVEKGRVEPSLLGLPMHALPHLKFNAQFGNQQIMIKLTLYFRLVGKLYYLYNLLNP